MNSKIKLGTDTDNSTEAVERFRAVTKQQIDADIINDTRNIVHSMSADIAKELELLGETKMTTNYEKYPHYFKPIPEGVTHLDVYATLKIWEVIDQAIGHAIKKLLVPGVRGSKSRNQDVQEAIDTLTRWQTLEREFSPKAAEPATLPPCTCTKEEFDANAGGGRTNCDQKYIKLAPSPVVPCECTKAQCDERECLVNCDFNYVMDINPEPDDVPISNPFYTRKTAPMESPPPKRMKKPGPLAPGADISDDYDD